MELKLIVLAGAKEGLEIPLKKDKFLIGRAKECSLRAGSEAISRRHCAIVRKDDAYTVRDLGSRNGTYVNETRIAEEVILAAGDELRVGPLHFKVHGKETVKPSGMPGAMPKQSDPLKGPKQPPVKDVADVIQRTVAKAEGSTSEDDITSWLLGPADGGNVNLKETLTMKFEETTANAKLPAMIEESESVIDETSETAAEAPTAEDSGKGSGWSLFKRNKPAAPPKKQPGKLPPRPEQQTKDSREAAADILREMTRRR